MTPMVISYLRFSTPEQEQGDSTRRQTKLVNDWLTAHNLVLSEDPLTDPGISAFRGKNMSQGPLAEFLDAVRGGRVPEGSILLVEDLDRISRQEPEKSVRIFLEIVELGVVVVTLIDQCEYRKGKMDISRLLISVIRFCLAHEESKKKSHRLAEAWKEKRANIRNEPLTRRVPAWCKIEGNKIVLDETKAEITRRIIHLALAGQGLTQITKKMNQETDGLARVKHFTRSYVFKILHNRAIIGEFQPHTMVYDGMRKRRVPDGDPLPDYYPRLCSDQEFYAIQQQFTERRSATGATKKFVNLFTALCYSLEDGSSFQITDKGYGKRFASAATMDGRKGACSKVYFPVRPFEIAVMFRLAQPDWFDDGDGMAREIQMNIDATEARIREVQVNVQQIQARVLNGKADGSSAVDLLDILYARRKELEKVKIDLQHELCECTNCSTKAFKQFRETMEKHRDETLTGDERLNLRHLLRKLVKKIGCMFHREGLNYACSCLIETKMGEDIELSFWANRRNTAMRNSKGHLIKTPGKSQIPEYDLMFWIPDEDLDLVAEFSANDVEACQSVEA